MRQCTLLLSCLPLTTSLGCSREARDLMVDASGSSGTGDKSTSTGDTSTSAAMSTTSTSAETAGSSDGGLGGTAGATSGGSTGTSETAASETTAAPGPSCGDGVQEGDEECDDANTDDADGCRGDCTREWLVFITSAPYTQGDLKGLVGTDYECRHRAAKAGLPAFDRYKAWISTSTEQPVDRLYHARGPYKLVNGLQVAASWDALVSGKLDNPINVTEFGEPDAGPVFTGTAPDGTRVEGSSHCDDWTDNDGDNSAWYGVATETDTNWTYAFKTGCDVGAQLYCFEQP